MQRFRVRAWDATKDPVEAVKNVKFLPPHLTHLPPSLEGNLKENEVLNGGKWAVKTYHLFTTTTLLQN